MSIGSSGIPNQNQPPQQQLSNTSSTVPTSNNHPAAGNTPPPNSPVPNQGVANNGPPPWLVAMAGGQPLSQVELQQFIRQLLGLPNHFPLLMAWLAEGSQGQPAQATQQALKQLFGNQLANLSQQQLAEQLLPKLTEAQNQLAKLLGQGNLPANQREQLQQTLTMLGQLTHSVQQQPMQAVQTMLALYLPIHPNTPFQAWLAPNGNGENNEQSEEGTDDDTYLVLVVTVPTVGIFLIHVLVGKGPATVVVHTPKNFTEIDTCHRQCITVCKSAGFDPAPNITFKPSDDDTHYPHPTDRTKPPSSPNVMVFPQQGLSPTALVLGATVAKVFLNLIH